MGIVYPPENHETDSKRIFVLGNAEFRCIINGQDITRNEKGNFAHLVDLKLGENLLNISVDGVLFNRKVTAKPSTELHPVAYAKTYEAFTDENSSSQNSIRSIIVDFDKITIPVNSEPDFTVTQDNAMSFCIEFKEAEFNLNWIYFASKKKHIKVLLDQKNVLRFELPMPIARYFTTFTGSSWEIELEYFDKPYMVCIDPGHGGNEIGALSPRGIMEKALNLSLARIVLKHLERPGIKAVLTRERDETLPLGARVDIAKKRRAVLFVSIHHNALPDGRDPNEERGFSVHYFNSESSDIANYCHEQLKSADLIPSAGIYKQNLHVLRENQDRLAILVESGFIIHPDESELIVTKEYQEKFGHKLANAIAEFLKNL
ncbi:MAG: N-acetylmuramoyl-L-alanine amidase [Candidatus Caenarcaniphilales bacterium]|jgi:N-acetylmuramoyl-L-alanine amidase|nr:N-acetylmuramoyl-L-alanine amidase [Candidatus Caenarcaniphilales bacterium]